MRLSDLLRMTLEHLGQHEVRAQGGAGVPGEVPRRSSRRASPIASSCGSTSSRKHSTRCVPTLILQPLVENAIKHGVSKKAGPGHIDITRAARRRQAVDGSPGRRRRACRKTALAALQKGIGVSTTRARLQHQFGADFRFEFHRLEPGLAVVVALPWRAERPAGSHAGRPTCRPARSGTARRRRTAQRRYGSHSMRQYAANAPALPGRDTIMKKIRTLIVDDEPLARERLAALLAIEPDIESWRSAATARKR